MVDVIYNVPIIYYGKYIICNVNIIFNGEYNL